jgi:hypothetical protein
MILIIDRLWAVNHSRQQELRTLPLQILQLILNCHVFTPFFLSFRPESLSEVASRPRPSEDDRGFVII